MKIDWKVKLTSRKFWALLCALIMAFGLARGTSPDSLEQVVAVIGAFGSVVIYMLAEAHVDGKRIENEGKDDEGTSL